MTSWFVVFFKHQTHVFDQDAIVNVHLDEKLKLLANVQFFTSLAIPRDANIISSQTVYKIKLNDDESSKLKARIAPHGSEDLHLVILHTESCICPRIEIRSVIYTATFRKWRVLCVDSESAFLQTGLAKQVVYAIIPYES